MSGRARIDRVCLPPGSVSGTRSIALREGWSLTRSAPGELAEPSELPADARSWSAPVPGTVAEAVGPPGLDGHEDYDASDWWYRCSFPDVERASGARVRLRLGGLATLAEVWLNGRSVLTSSNMFLAHDIDVTDLLADDNRLCIVFRSLGEALAARRPRPRWKTRVVDEQQLRWFRTTLLGRIPGWTPAISPVGPWRPARLDIVEALDVDMLRLRTSVDDDGPRVELDASVRPMGPESVPESAALLVGDHSVAVDVEPRGPGWRLRARESLPGLQLWWPRTHGEPALHDCRLELKASGRVLVVSLGRVGFRRVEVDEKDGGIRLHVNGEPVFCRGSCWTTGDIVTLAGSEERVARLLELAAEANANMLRVGGTMVYEADAFYAKCDELGVMVWQDFMFANMDYPSDDEGFSASVEAEVAQQVERLQRHPSLVTFCGGSEVEQQAAMFGADRSIWSSPLFAETLPGVVTRLASGTPYWPSTPTGGDMPFHVGTGLTHYYGVGAYKRPLSDVRLAGVRFTPECLGFSNVPEASNLQALESNASTVPHHPAWKAGVPRDSGAGWDFEDIRDWYLEHLYAVDPVTLRSEDPSRYLELSRVVTGEVMERVMAEWRGPDSGCGGALTWFFNDLRPGAGWGVVDSDGKPKAAYHHLRRAWAPLTVRLLDRGLDGLSALVVNERPERWTGSLKLAAFPGGAVPPSEAEVELSVDARDSRVVPVERAFGHFLDSTYSYRFGPPRHEVIAARLLDSAGAVVASDAFRPVHSRMTPAPPPQCRVSIADDDTARLELEASAPLYDVRVDVRDHEPDDDHFCLLPGRTKVVGLRRVGQGAGSFRGYVEAANLAEAVRLTLDG